MGVSYTRQVKAELANSAFEPVPCLWAELWGLAGRSVEPVGEEPWLVTTMAVVARRGFHLMKRLNLAPVIRVHRHAHRGRFELFGGDVPAFERIEAVKWCPAAYFRGVFLARGYLADIDRWSHLEWVVGDQDEAEWTRELLERLRIRAKILPRRGSRLVYLKDREQIARFLAAIGAHRAVLDLESQRVVKSVKNQVQRLVNSEAANLRRAAESGSLQAAELARWKESGRFKNLPESLRLVAELRLAHPEWSLAEIGQGAHPPLTKSAVNHRLRKIRQWISQDQGPGTQSPGCRYPKD